jgi:hypothetical protein
MTEISDQITPFRNLIGTEQRQYKDIDSTDCTGNHAVMAEQVRPWLVKPAVRLAREVRKSDRAPTSTSHQGPRQIAASESECTGAIFTFTPS